MAQLVSWQAAEAAAKRFQALFQGTARSWQVAGHVRRRKDGPMQVLHMAVPGPVAHPDLNPVWARALELLVTHRLALHAYPGGLRGPEPDSTLAGFDLCGWRHEISLGRPGHEGPRLAELTGPPGYWRMLLHRLRLAGTLRVHQGAVCAINRSLSGPACGAENLVEIPCPDEATFFKLARTRWRDPAHRFERPVDNTRDWNRGVLPEWYPPGVLPYADPLRSPELFDASRIADPKYVGQERERWRHS